MVKKYILSLVALIVTMSINAQVLKVYKNGEKTPVACFVNTLTDKYTVGVRASDILPGIFTVGTGADGKIGTADDKKVKFTNGNLYWNGSEFKLERNQTAYPTSWNPNHIGHFYWTKEAANSYALSYGDGTSTNNDVPFFAQSKDVLTVAGMSGLWALSKDEWEYLINTRANASNLMKESVSVSNNGTTHKNCLIIAPDDYNYTTNPLKDSYTLQEINSLGLVCLPAAGWRSSSKLQYVGSWGNYWLSTPAAGFSHAPLAYQVTYGGGPLACSPTYRLFAFCLRLVKLVE